MLVLHLNILLKNIKYYSYCLFFSLYFVSVSQIIFFTHWLFYKSAFFFKLTNKKHILYSKFHYTFKKTLKNTAFFSTKFYNNSLLRYFLKSKTRKTKKIKRLKQRIKFNKAHKKIRLVHAVNFLKYTSFKTGFNQNFKKFQAFSLQQRVFLTGNYIKETLVNFLYKGVKTRLLLSPFFETNKKSLFPYVHLSKNYSEPCLKKQKNKINPLIISNALVSPSKKIIFLNGHKPLIWKMRTARYEHWNLKTYGKLNEWRYHKLLAHSLGSLKNFLSYQFLALLLLKSYSVSLSWRQSLRFFSFNLVLLNGVTVSPFLNSVKGDIFEIPYGAGIYKLNKTLNKIYSNNVRKVKKYVYNSYLLYSGKNKNIKRSKKASVFFKRLPMAFVNFGFKLAWDSSVNCMGIIYKLPPFSHFMEQNLTKTSVLTLQNWRYRFD